MGVGEYMHEHLKGSTLKVLEVPGHCAHMSHPALVVDAMQEYFNEPSPGHKGNGILGLA